MTPLHHRPLTNNQVERIAAVQAAGAADQNAMGREVSLAKTKVEEAVMWATKGILA